MKLHTIETGNFKLDGGAMFGVVPKTIWQKLNPSDENNLCNWAMRCLLIEDGNKLILVDNGIGNKQDAKFFSHYYLNGDASLDKSLHQLGFHKNDITDVFLTHLHFDHCGGSISLENGQLVPTFKNATYWSNEAHWEWATKPNAREKASFLKDNILPIQQSGQLQFIPTGKIDEPVTAPFHNDISILFADGHTNKMMLPQIQYKGHTVVFMADLLPSIAHIPLPYVMAYDMFPLTTLNEKEYFLNKAVKEKYVLFFEHDIQNECCNLTNTEKGIRQNEIFRLQDL
ncbi:MBL fold metallo-hydrolase [Hydrotalea sandarakina]|jgi:glyoxylase-like metal-dependent hydrolase (beta-lactamase superfamily II)|uniref:Glyoxylase-like metal-dependent hydrolase (Beta-lactamase superfamily II) n=1 Tax=Hydrotalea sandarakina TaxID=1004304 RepID=A0A2W7RKV4_9BACT|nr:MBL fold metallo-hydrolase [Hydrotalea sandarakina]PZX61463.1 glyoxylase-like metal-dependent hydrolase (beta-lactamase superfamily II) [Hydrotalea sandarakina]